MNDNQHDQARIHHETRDFGHSADVFDPVLVREAKILVEPVPDVIPVQ